jgi:hydrogenase expression/formation protein HypC
MSALAASACTGQHCVTCSDEGVPMTIVRIDGRRGLALCANADGERHIVEIGLLEDPTDGATVLVHAGVAIAALDNFEASG